jgi:hypothetical protein
MASGAGGPATSPVGARRGSIDGALRGILQHLGGRTLAPDEPAGMVAARIVDRLHGGEPEARLPEFLALVPLGYWLAEMVAYFGGAPVSEATQEAAAQLLGVLRGGDGRRQAALDKRYPGEILEDVLEEVRKRVDPEAGGLPPETGNRRSGYDHA